MMDLISSSKRYIPKIWDHWKWQWLSNQNVSLSDPVLYLSPHSFLDIYLKTTLKGVNRECRVRRCFCNLCLAQSCVTSRYSLQLHMPIILFPPTPAVFGAQNRWRAFNEQLFNSLFPSHCSICGPRPYLQHVFQTPLWRQNYYSLGGSSIVLIKVISRVLKNN